MSTSLKLDSMIWELYVDIKNDLNLENPVYKQVCRPLYKIVQTEMIFFLPNLLTPIENFSSLIFKMLVIRHKEIIDNQSINQFSSL